MRRLWSPMASDLWLFVCFVLLSAVIRAVLVRSLKDSSMLLFRIRALPVDRVLDSIMR